MQPRPTAETPGRRRPRGRWGSAVTREPYAEHGQRMRGSMWRTLRREPPWVISASTEILIILVIIVLLFGSSRLPGIARGTGKHLRKTKDSVGTFKEEFESGMREIDPVAPIKETMARRRAAQGRGAEGREDRLALTGVSGSPPLQHRRGIARRQHGHRRARLDRGRAEVRDQHGVLELEQARMHLGLVLEHVEARARDHARRAAPRPAPPRRRRGRASC